MARLPDLPVLWSRPGMQVQHWQQAGGAQLEVVLTETARTRQCFGESYPAWDRDSGLYNLNVLPARWPSSVAAARYGATAAGAAQLEVFLTGTARTRQCFGESDSARDRAR